MASAQQEAKPVDFRWSAYLGYVGVELSDDVICEGPACNGILDDTAFYGLSASLAYAPFQLQAVVSQDQNGEPELSLAQLSMSQLLGNWQSQLRLGKIINPLGLFGANRITPTARPGLELPQSFFLNAYYDLLTTSEYGAAVEFRQNDLVLKATVFRPEPDAIRTVVINDDNVENGNVLDDISDAVGDLTGINLGLGVLGPLLGLGGDMQPGAGDPAEPNTTIRVENIEKTSYFVGVEHDGFDRLYDAGYTQLRLGDERIEAFSLGGQHQYGQWFPSIELTQLRARNAGTKTKGVSLTLLYQAQHWSAFANGTHFSSDRLDSTDYNIGAAYFHKQWTFKLSAHQLERTADDNAGDSIDLLDTNSVAFAISYRIR